MSAHPTAPAPSDEQHLQDEMLAIYDRARFHRTGVAPRPDQIRAELRWSRVCASPAVRAALATRLPPTAPARGGAS